MQPGACSATASANRRPGCSSQLRAKCVTKGGCRVPQCTGMANRAPLSGDGPCGRLGGQMAGREPRSPPPDRHQRNIDGAARHGRDRGHLRKQPRVAGDPDGARRAPDQLAVGGVRTVRHGAAAGARPAPGAPGPRCRSCCRLRSSRPPGEQRSAAAGVVARRRSPGRSSGLLRAACGGSAARRGRGAGGRGARRRAGSTTPGPAGAPGAAATRHGDAAAGRSGSGPRPGPGPPRSGRAT